MVFSAASLFILFLSLVTSVLSAPVNVRNPNGARFNTEDPRFNLDEQPPAIPHYLGHLDQFTVHPSLVPRMSASDELGAHSTTSIASDAEIRGATSMRRRSILSKMKKAFKKAGSAMKKVFQKAGFSIKKGVQKAANMVKKGVNKATSGIKKGVNKAVNGVKKVANKAGKGIKNAAKKVSKFAKENGAKIAKVGLAGLSTYYNLASHVAAFVPGVGKPLGQALKLTSKAADIASDQIPVKLDGKWGKAAGIMEKIKNPIGGAAGKVFDAVLKRDLEGTSVFRKDV